jgi:hypothetical protein
MGLRGLQAWLRPYAEWCLEVANYYGVPVVVTSTYRSWSEQQELRTRWERGQSRWPANRPGDSAHNYGLAWDSTVPSWAQTWWNDVRRAAGFEVLSNDEIHAQYPRWRDLVRGEKTGA